MVLRALDHLEEWLIATLIAAATILIFFAVLHRYGTGASIDLSKWATAHGLTLLASVLLGVFRWLSSIDVSWAQELCIYMFIWMAKFGAAYGVRTGIHVGVDVFVNMLGPNSRKRVIVFGLLCGALFTATVAVFGGAFVWKVYHTGIRSNDLEVRMWIVFSAIPLGSGLMCFRFLQVAWWFFWTGALPHHDASHVAGVEDDNLHPEPVATETRIGDFSSLGLIIILVPMLIVAICFAREAHLIALPQGLRGLILFALLLSLMFTGMPVSIALGLTVLTFMFTLTEVPTELVALKLFTGLESFEIMAIPFFILAGTFLTHGGVARRMINFATSMVGHWYGGLGLAGVVACALFAAVSGSSPATVVAIGSVIMPAMVAQGFPKRFGAGVIATLGALGILIPPSIVMVLYAVATNPRLASCSSPASFPASCWRRCSAPPHGTAPGATAIRACQELRSRNASSRSANRSGACCWSSSSWAAFTPAFSRRPRLRR